MSQTDLIIYLTQKGLTPDNAITVVKGSFREGLRLLNQIEKVDRKDSPLYYQKITEPKIAVDKL